MVFNNGYIVKWFSSGSVSSLSTIPAISYGPSYLSNNTNNSNKKIAINTIARENISNIPILIPAMDIDFTGSTGTFKGDDDNKGFVFGLASINPEIGYGAGKNDTGNTPETVANTPVSITLTSFSYSGSISATYGNVTAEGTFSGTVYDIKNKTFVALTDGTFTVHP